MSDHQVWNELGNVYIISNEPEKALKAYKKALELNPEAGWTHNNVALAYIHLAEPQKAIEHYQRSIELFEDFADKAEVWHRLGTAYQMLDDTPNTLLAFERAAALAPENAEYQASMTSLFEDEIQSNDGQELVHAPAQGVETAPLMESAPLDIKKKLIPISAEKEDESVDLDPGVEELMNKLSRVIEREVGESAETDEASLSVEETTVEENEKKAEESTKQPKWLTFEETEEDSDSKTPFAKSEHQTETHEFVSKNSTAPDDEANIESEDTFVPAEKENITGFFDEIDIVEDEDNDENEDELDDEFDNEYEFEDADSEEDEEEDDDFEAELDEDEEIMLAKQNRAAETEIKTVAQEDNRTEDVMQNATVWGEMGNIFFNSDVYDGALIAYRKALELDDNYGAVMHNLALLYMQRGEYDQAVELYQESIKLLQDPAAQATSWNNLGNAYRALRDYENAGDAYRKADELTSPETSVQAWQHKELISTKLT